MKICITCKEEKDESLFSKRGKGFAPKCKQCHNDYVKNVWYPKNKEKQIKSSLEWKKKNREHVNASDYKRKYKNIDLSSVTEKPTTCEICGDATRICLDHCHTSDEFRGWLCSSCNLALGNFKDNIENLLSAITYLEKFKSRKSGLVDHPSLIS